MFEWFWKLFVWKEPKPKSPFTQPLVEPLVESSDTELQIKKPKIYMCKAQRCKNAANYTFYEAYDHNFKCADCKSPVTYI